MRWLISYIRSCFCHHDIKVIDGMKFNPWGLLTRPIKTFYCSKCGMTKQRWC